MAGGGPAGAARAARGLAREARLGGELAAQLERLAGALEQEAEAGLWAGVAGAGGGGEGGSSRGEARWAWDYAHKGPRPVTAADGLQLLPEAGPESGESGRDGEDDSGEGEGVRDGGGTPEGPGGAAGRGGGKRPREEDGPAELAAHDARGDPPEKEQKKKAKKDRRDTGSVREKSKKSKKDKKKEKKKKKEKEKKSKKSKNKDE